MEIQLTPAVKQRVDNLQKHLNDVYQQQVEVISIFLDSREDVPTGKKWKLNESGTHVIIEVEDETEVTEVEQQAEQ